jgi:hypothetical protein
VRVLWFHLPLYRAEVRVRWAIGCHNGQKLPDLPGEPEPAPKDFEGPHEPPERDDIPDPDYVITENHGFRGSPKSKSLPCNKLTTIRYVYYSDAGSVPPDDYEPFVDKALANAKLYVDSFWCDSPCWPQPTMAVTRREWSYDEREESADAVLYITFLCTPGGPGGEGGEEGK